MSSASPSMINLLDKTKPPHKIIWFLAWPTIVEQLLSTLIGYVDSAMVGSLGASATAAISVNTSSIWLVNGLMFSVGVGFSVLMARNLGAGNKDTAKIIVKQAIIAVLTIGTAISILMSFIGNELPLWMGAPSLVVDSARLYMKWISVGFVAQMGMFVFAALLRSSGDTRTPLILNIATNVVDIILNFIMIFPSRTITIFGQDIFVYGMDMGVEGASLSTTIVIFAGAIALCVMLFRKRFVAQARFKDSWKLHPKIIRSAFKLALPVALERATLNSGQIVLTRMISGLGEVALASHYLANTAETIAFLPATGFSSAATTLVAHSLGAKEKGLAHRYARSCILFGTTFMLVASVLIFVFAPQLISIFSSVPEVVSLGSTVLRIEALGEPFFGLSMMVFGILRGAGDTKGPFYLALLGMWIVRIPGAWFLITLFGFGLQGVWIAMMADMVVRGAASFIRFKKGAWLHVWDKRQGEVPAALIDYD
ncbi:MATE family efflux transporter [Parasphaerochaeta coccoides]|uniref:Multidrug-efflux transporter n=1 Tax=Parasphaerochaeta coccoides (strain ATCC BAA-1237 / DSM 17374 / SPN1) TaxID=760011 RepID=F4GJH0_PARC1|nr:MATE family efflux transporter [Parasphaerochaeta coccoides]AEC02235.1 MATE efflux family protein [Parasphaerochaeta coccoides DSM 17374]